MHLLSTCIFFQTTRWSASGFFCECRLICLAEARLDCVFSVACNSGPQQLHNTHTSAASTSCLAQYSQSPATHFCCSQLATRGCAPASTWLHVLYVKVYINRVIWSRFKQQQEHSLYCGANLCNRCCFIKKKTLVTCFFNCGRVLAKKADI